MDLSSLLKNKYVSLIGAVLVIFLMFSYDRSMQKIKLDCIDGNCRVLNGQQVLESFNSDDIKSCYPSVFRRYCRNKIVDLTNGRKCYYPELTLKNGRSLRLHHKFDSKYKSDINEFCSGLKSNRNFKYN